MLIRITAGDKEERRMDHLELVEKLREKANVSYEEAREALEASDWDLLDALLMLESEGRLHEMEKAAYSTRQEDSARRVEKKATGKGVFASLMHGLAGLIKKGNAVSVQIKKKNELRLALPLTVVIIALVFMFWWMLIAAVIAMICGYRFSIQGLSIDESVNSAMNKAGEFVDNVVKPAEVKIEVNRKEAENDTENEN